MLIPLPLLPLLKMLFNPFILRLDYNFTNRIMKEVKELGLNFKLVEMMSRIN